MRYTTCFIRSSQFRLYLTYLLVSKFVLDSFMSITITKTAGEHAYALYAHLSTCQLPLPSMPSPFACCIRWAQKPVNAAIVLAWPSWLSCHSCTAMYTVMSRTKARLLYGEKQGIDLRKRCHCGWLQRSFYAPDATMGLVEEKTVDEMPSR